MKFIETMNSLVKQDIIDLAKVNIPGWSVIVWVQSAMPDINSLIQETGTSLLVLATLAYTIFKAINMFRHMRWAKEDRHDDEIGDSKPQT